MLRSPGGDRIPGSGSGGTRDPPNKVSLDFSGFVWMVGGEGICMWIMLRSGRGATLHQVMQLEVEGEEVKEFSQAESALL